MVANNVFEFYVDRPGSHSPCGQRMHQDVCYHPLVMFRSTVFPASIFALFTYPAELYLVGCDVTRSGHFYDNTPNETLNVKALTVGWARIKAFAEHHYPETKIISINPIGLKGLFEDIYTDEYKKSLAESV